jgi:hypothetical protein
VALTYSSKSSVSGSVSITVWLNVVACAGIVTVRV